VTQQHSKYIVHGIVGVILLLLVWRIYWNRPTIIIGTGPVNELEIGPDSVTITLNPGVTVGQAVDLEVFEGFTFETSGYKAEQTLGPSDKWQEEGEASYNEYIRPRGRLRFYQAPEYGEEGWIVGMADWVQALPNELLADHFFCKDIAKHLDLSRQTQKVYISVPAERCTMTVHLDGNRVARIAWLPHCP